MPAPVIVIFGVTGDLSTRRLLPAIYHLLSDSILPADTKIIGLSRQLLTTDELLGTFELCVLEHDNICDPEGLKKVRDSLICQQLDPKASEDFQKLKTQLDKLDSDGVRQRLFYMAVPPTAYAPIVEQLAAAGLTREPTRLLLEKPFGYNLQSAQELITLVDQHFKESQIYRIDHYLAKETAQNLLAFRLYNPIFSSLWSAEHIQKVHIRAIQKIDIEGRTDFYEKTGALRDLIQSHLMQLLALTLMELPIDMSSEQIHRSKQYFLEQLQPADPTKTIRGQYDGYRQEVNNPSSNVETYVNVQLSHLAERWRGVEISLETGKALVDSVTDITVTFKGKPSRPANSLHFNIQPHEGLALDLLVKQPGYENNMSQTSLNLTYAQSFEGSAHIDAYERVLNDAVRGDQSLFASNEEVLATWRILQPLIDAWSSNNQGLQIYPSGANPQNI